MTFEMRLEETKRYGIELGRAEGFAEGLAEGLAEGIADIQSSIIKTMQEQGLTKEQIVRFTGLSQENVEEILKKLNQNPKQ